LYCIYIQLKTKKAENSVTTVRKLERYNMSDEKLNEELLEETAETTEDTAEATEEVNEIEEDITEEVAEEDMVVTKLPSKKQRNRKKNVETQEAKPESEWKEQVVQISRVTKVVKGGKKLSFRAVVIVGNKKGQVGVGCAKAAEVIIAIQKAIADGRKNLINVPIFKTTIPHPIVGRSGAGKVMLRPASQGTGIIAGGAVRPVLELAGIENILTKSQGSKSPLNAAYATIEALKSLRMFNDVAKKRGLTMAELLN
jgi:small subunit ribosomal protein S5